ncbi:MAG: TrbI/VirB10 family protein [Novosphingobium sp.]
MSEPFPGSAAAGPARPEVAPQQPPRGGWLIGVGATALGVLCFVLLYAAQAPASDSIVTRSGRPADLVAPLAPPAEFAAVEAAAHGAAPEPTSTPPALPFAAPLPPETVATAGFALPSAAVQDETQRLKAPALIVDLSVPPPAPANEPAKASPGDMAKVAGGKGSNAARLDGDEQFAERVSAAEPERARASQLRNLATVVPQGAIIPAVLETALNSDLPGFARAVVSRDVRGFDGSTAVIPRGSRLVGQYKSAVAQGQSRAFVIWTRVIRPDGVSIQIGSPAADTLGRAGLAGRVNRHFFQRFTNSVLLSVVNASIASVSRGSGTQILIGSSQEATGLAASLLPTEVIPPTIKIAQGTPVRVFVARDLDFTAVGGDDE